MTIFEQVACQDANDALITFDHTTFNQFTYSGQRRCGGRLAAKTSAIDYGFSCQNFFVGHVFYNTIAFFDHAARTCVAHGIADLYSSSDGLRLDRFPPGKSLFEATIEWIGSFCLDRGKAWHMLNKRELISLAKGFTDGRGVAKIACRKDKPVRSLPVELLQYLKADSFLSFNAKWIEGVKQVDAQLATDLFNQVHGVIKISLNLDGRRTIGQ